MLFGRYLDDGKTSEYVYQEAVQMGISAVFEQGSLVQQRHYLPIW